MVPLWLAGSIDPSALFAFFIIGDKKFLMGDTPCEQDSAIFGLLSAMDWQGHGHWVDATLKSNFLQWYSLNPVKIPDNHC